MKAFFTGALLAQLVSVASGLKVQSAAAAPAIELASLELDEAPVRKPITDHRNYAHAEFDSGLRVLVVEDPDAEKSSFAVAVEAGSLEDPPDFQGLAHFCEHMLFLGSKKYPDNDAFSAALARHGGTHNAYTSAEETVYFNEIDDEGLEGALDIFAQFFIAPSFDPAMVDKEINAVDSEHKKNQPDTQHRLWHLLRSKANPKNPMHKFSTGDLSTLKTVPESQGKNLSEALRSFHRDRYCARRLHLVMVSNRSTTEQLAIAHKHFDDVPKATKESCPPRSEYLDMPAYSKELGNLGRVFGVAAGGAPEMWVVFPVLPLKHRYKELAEAYVWNALGHYGPGSLKALLMREDLSQSYSFYAEKSVAGSFIFVTFALTEKGASNVDQVLEYLFAYLHAVKGAGVDAKLLASLRQLREVEFDYQEKRPSEIDFAKSIAGSLPTYGPRDVLTGGVLMDDPNEELILQILNAMEPSNMNIALVRGDFNEKKATQHEQYYDFGYNESSLDPALIKRLQNASGFGLTAPPNLQFVPRHLELINESSSEDMPERLLKRNRTESWWLGLGEVRLPKAIVSIKIGFPPAVLARVKDAALAAVHVRLVDAALEESADALQTCGLSYSVSAARDGLAISFTGFDEHMEELMKLVLPKVLDPGTADDEFDKALRQLVLDLSDNTKMQPYQHALEAFEVVTTKASYSRAEVLRVAKDSSLVSISAYKAFLRDLFADAQLSILFTGNIGRTRALAITETVQSELQITTASSDWLRGGLEVVDPKEDLEVRVANPIPDDPNSATIVVYQFGVPTIADRIHLAMITEVIDRPIFETLRTEHQLGYVVFGYAAPHASIVEVRVIVQGFRESPDVVATLIESTVQNLTNRIAAMDQKEFDSRKQSLRNALAKKASTMSQYAGRYWGQIWNQEYCFQKRAMQLAYLDSEEFNSPTPLLQAWKKSVSPSENRKKILVKLFGANGTQSVSMDGTAGSKLVTLVDSASVAQQMKDENYWPREFLCK